MKKKPLQPQMMCWLSVPMRYVQTRPKRTDSYHAIHLYEVTSNNGSYQPQHFGVRQ